MRTDHPRPLGVPSASRVPRSYRSSVAGTISPVDRSPRFTRLLGRRRPPREAAGVAAFVPFLADVSAGELLAIAGALAVGLLAGALLGWREGWSSAAESVRESLAGARVSAAVVRRRAGHLCGVDPDLADALDSLDGFHRDARFPRS